MGKTKTGDKTVVELLRLDDIDDQNVIQLREKRSEATVQEYAEIYGEHPKGTLPPIVVFRTPLDDQRNLDIVADGDHRVRAARAAGLKRIEAEIRYGDRDAAVLYACGCNARHGLRRTNGDKRRAVQYLLGRPAYVKKADRWIADKCAVSNTFVGNVRGEMRLSTVDSEREGRDGRKIKTKHIGRGKKSKAALRREHAIERKRIMNLPSPSGTVANDPSAATVPTPPRAPSPAALCSVCHEQPAVDGQRCQDCIDKPLCSVCGNRDAVDGQRCQACIDAGLTGDEEDALQAQTGAGRPQPELQGSGDGVESLDAELAKLAKADVFSHGMMIGWTKGGLLQAARLIVQRLEAETMPPDVQHCARLLGMVLDGFKGLRSR